MDKKVCPIMMLSNTVKEDGNLCLGDKCAWWVIEKTVASCSVKDIATSLDWIGRNTRK